MTAVPNLQPDLAVAAAFLEALTGSADTPVTFQTFHDREKGKLAVHRYGTLAECATWLTSQNRKGAGVYVTVNATDGKGRTKANITGLRALFVEDDAGAIADPAALEPPPSIIVQSKKGAHIYWLLQPGEDVRRAEPAIAALIHHLGTDAKVKDVSRVLRLPGFYHMKGEPFMVTLQHADDSARYTIDQLLAVYPPPPPDPRPARAVPSAPVGAPRTDAELDAHYARNALAGAAREVAACAEGGRNNLLNTQAFKMGTFVGAGVLDYDTAEEELIRAGVAAGLPESEAKATVRSGLRGGEKKPHDMDKVRAERKQHAKAMPPRPPVGSAAPVPAPVPEPAAEPVSLEEFKAAKGTPVPEILAKLGAVVTREEPWKAGGRKWFVEVCPWADDPEGHVAHVAQFPKGSIVAGCSHPACAGKKWSDFKAAYAPKKAPPKVREVRGTEWPPIPTDVPANEHEMLANYVVLVGTEKVWDRRKSAIVTPAAMKLAHGDDFKAWAKDPDRLMVDADKLVFKPEGSEPGELNLFSGLPVLTVGDPEGVTAWMDHALKMAGYNAELMHWIVTRLAYKVQNPGKKIASSIVIHGEQGTGKNLFFAPLIAIFGRYGAVVGQQQIESPYTDWLSGKLMLVADEVASRGERYHVKNKLKALITSDMLAINEKFVSTRWERNCADIHFLSNDHIPLVVERGDRRYCVTRDDEVTDEAYNAKLAAVDPGALKAALLAWDCGGFHAHTKPPETKAKRALLDLTQEPADRFVDLWLAGDLPVPAVGATSADLYKAYDIWSKTSGERKVVQSAIEFGRHVGARLTRFSVWYSSRTTWAWSTNGEKPSFDDLESFQKALALWVEREQRARL
jgi:putative DNA primase/helicase